MKLKLFLISILALLSLVAYQKYTEYSALKSIDSYESCIVSKGSVIQESYPATCITRLGTHFTQNTWKKFISSPYKFSINYPSYSTITTKKYQNGNEYYIIFNNGENQQPFLQISIISDEIPSPLSVKEYIEKRYKIFNGYTHFGSAPSRVAKFDNLNIDNHEGYLISQEQKLNSEYNSYEVFVRLNDQTVLIIDPGAEPQTPSDQELFNQILSTIKFTD